MLWPTEPGSPSTTLRLLPFASEVLPTADPGLLSAAPVLVLPKAGVLPWPLPTTPCLLLAAPDALGGRPEVLSAEPGLVVPGVLAALLTEFTVLPISQGLLSTAGKALRMESGQPAPGKSARTG